MSYEYMLLREQNEYDIMEAINDSTHDGWRCISFQNTYMDPVHKFIALLERESK